MAYVYLHKRKDTGIPFYIGVGGIGKFDNYQRANACNRKGLKSRSDFWRKTANLYGFEVEIILNNCSSEEAFSKEIELISFYGRQDVNTGILVNHTAGGEGRKNSSEEINKKCGLKNIGKIPSKETLLKRSISLIGKKQTKEDRLKKSIAHKGKSKNYIVASSKRVIDTITGITYDSCVKAAKSINMNPGTLRSMLLGKNPNKTNFKYI